MVLNSSICELLLIKVLLVSLCKNPVHTILIGKWCGKYKYYVEVLRHLSKNYFNWYARKKSDDQIIVWIGDSNNFHMDSKY